MCGNIFLSAWSWRSESGNMKGRAHNLSQVTSKNLSQKCCSQFFSLHVTCPAHHNVDCMNECSCFVYSLFPFLCGLCSNQAPLYMSSKNPCPSYSSFCMMPFITCSYIDLSFFFWALFFQVRIHGFIGILSRFVSFIPKTFLYYFILLFMTLLSKVFIFKKSLVVSCSCFVFLLYILKILISAVIILLISTRIGSSFSGGGFLRAK